MLKSFVILHPCRESGWVVRLQWELLHSATKQNVQTWLEDDQTNSICAPGVRPKTHKFTSNPSAIQKTNNTVVFTNQILISASNPSVGTQLPAFWFGFSISPGLTAAFLHFQKASSLRPTVQFNGLQGVSTGLYLNVLVFFQMGIRCD